LTFSTIDNIIDNFRICDAINTYLKINITPIKKIGEFKKLKTNILIIVIMYLKTGFYMIALIG
jgi:hypothetical protein